jgi:DUF971 family protein
MRHTPDPATRPTRIVRDAERRTLWIPWADGHESLYDWEYLRRNCPCAHCQGEWGRPGAMRSDTLLLAGQEFLKSMQHVGHYAVQLIWGDDHSTGIYSFAHLRALCPCSACQARRQPEA